MPGQLLPLRLLSTCVSSRSFSNMKLGATIQSSREFSIFNRVFPFKLKYMGFSRRSGISVLQNEESGVRRFSTRSLRSRNGGSSGRGGRNSEGSRGRGVEGGEFQGGSYGGRGGQAKSLVEDEAELSDWISELKTKSLRVGLSSESDDSDRDRGRSSNSFSSMKNQRGGRDGFSSLKRRGESDYSNRDRDMDRGRGRGRGSIKDSFSSMKSQRGGRDGFSSSKRPRDSGSDDFSVNSRSNTRNTAGSFLRNPRGSMSSSVSKRRVASESEEDTSESEEDEDEEFYPQRKDRGSRGALSSPMRRSGRDSDLSNGRGQGGGNFLRGGKGSGRQTLLTSEDDNEGNDLMSGRGSRSAVSSPMRRSGRDIDLSYGRGRGGGNLLKGGKGSGRQALLTSEDEDEDEDEDDEGEEAKNLMPGFENFVSEEDSEEDEEEDAVKSGSSMPGSDKEVGAQLTPRSSAGKTDSYLSQTRFDQCSISSLSLKGIKDAGYERMTVVQEATLPVILRGKDVLAKAKTGTGKTVAFLLPSIEAIVKSPPVDRDQKRPPIYVLIVCPTRELANQAAAEANTLLKYHPSLGVQVVIGGTRLTLEQKRMQANPCQILVATPGRLKDHIENTAGFATRLMGVKVLVLDEADHLLDMGFRKDIEKIIAAVPKQRQTLLFSATVPEEVRQVCHFALKRDHEFINTVEEGSEETHSQVRQMNLVAPLDKQFSLLYVLLKEHIADDLDYKVLVFCTTAMVTRLVAGLLSELNLNVREIHSRKPQSYRTRVSDEFRRSKGLILVTSDVSARGVDYPDVTLVIQVGVPADREQYIHRLGRTGRKGKEGQGILLLAPWEEFFLSTVKDLPITKASVPSVDPDTRKKVERALSHVEMKNKEAAYQAWLGYYNSNKSVARDKCRLVELANEFSRSMGLDNPPAIPKLVLGKMGLRNVPGLRSK